MIAVLAFSFSFFVVLFIIAGAIAGNRDRRLQAKCAEFDELSHANNKAWAEVCRVRSILSTKFYEHHSKASAGDCCCKKKLHFDFGEELRGLFETSKEAENLLFWGSHHPQEKEEAPNACD